MARPSAPVWRHFQRKPFLYGTWKISQHFMPSFIRGRAVAACRFCRSRWGDRCAGSAHVGPCRRVRVVRCAYLPVLLGALDEDDEPGLPLGELLDPEAAPPEV